VCQAFAAAGDATSANITPSSASTHPGGQYIYRLGFTVSEAEAPLARITGRWSVDDAGVDILLNGVPQAITAPFAAFTPFEISTGFRSGINTLDFIIRNRECGGCVGNPASLRVELTGTIAPALPPPTFVDFTVNESSVPPPTFPLVLTADKIVGVHSGTISFDGTGGWGATLVIDFAKYRTNEGRDAVFSQLTSPERGSGPQYPEYGLYATVTARGIVFSPGTSGASTVLTPTSAEARLFIDPNLDTLKTTPGVGGDPLTTFDAAGDDYLIMRSTVTTEPSAIGLVPGVGGYFDLRFSNPSLTAAGMSYWPTLANLVITVVIDGDIIDVDPVGTVLVNGIASFVIVQ
jgi:hypothetical protein